MCLLWPLTIKLNVYGIHDDFLFIKLANSLLEGNWLGEYNFLTLVKGPVYSFFIAINSFTNIPIKVSEYLFYVLACTVFYISYKLIAKRKIFPEVLFFILILSPYVEIINRLVRGSIYAATVIFVLAFFNFIYFAKNRNRILLSVTSVFTGVFIFIFWYTREEGIWLLPYFIIVSSFIIISIFCQYKITKESLIRSLLCVLFIPTFFLADTCYALKNKAEYGTAITLDIKTKEYVSAFEALYRVHNYSEKKIPFYQLNRATRAEMYKVSESLKSVSKNLEINAKNFSPCRKNPKTCDVHHGWFPWIFRASLKQLELYSTPEIANKFYGKVAQEINSACRDSLLRCHPIRNANLATFRTNADTLRFYQSLREGMSFLNNGISGYNLTNLSAGRPKDIEFCANILNMQTQDFFTTENESFLKKQKEVSANIKILENVYFFYNNYLVKLFFWGSLMCLLILFFFGIKKLKLGYLSVSAFALLSIVFGRIIILSIIKATAYNGFQIRYVVCIFPLLMISFFFLLNDVFYFLTLKRKITNYNKKEKKIV